MSHKIPNFPSTTGVLRLFICPKFVFERSSRRSPRTPSRLGRAHPHSQPLASRSRCPEFHFPKVGNPIVNSTSHLKHGQLIAILVIRQSLVICVRQSFAVNASRSGSASLVERTETRFLSDGISSLHVTHSCNYCTIFHLKL